MGNKQKFSLAAASILPILAVAAYFLFAPPVARAGSCPNGGIFDPCNGNSGSECNSGTGYCWGNGSTNGIYVFCNGDGNVGGPGTCTNGCVTCKDGER